MVLLYIIPLSSISIFPTRKKTDRAAGIVIEIQREFDAITSTSTLQYQSVPIHFAMIITCWKTTTNQLILDFISTTIFLLQTMQ